MTQNSKHLGMTLYVAMGVVSLMFQALWQRELSLLTGNTLYGISLVLGGWMAGFGTGSLLALFYARKIKKPLLTLAWVQIAVVGLALVSLSWFDVMRGWTSGWVFVGVFASVFLPSTAWGMGLPLVGGVLGEKAISSLYGWNALASAVAVLLTNFVLLPLLGVRLSLLVAVAVGGGVFAGCVAVAKAKEHTPTGVQPVFRWQGGGFILLLFGLSGFTSLAYQLIYNRQLLYFVGNTIYGYGIVTAIFIAGLAGGSLLYHRYRERLLNNLYLVIGAGQIVIALWHVAFPFLSLAVNNFLVVIEGPGLVGLFLVRFLAPVLLIGVPVMVFGFLYPAFLALFHHTHKGGVSEDTALAATINTLGSVVGILLAAFGLIGWIGISLTLRVFALLSGGIGLVALLRAGKKKILLLSGAGLLLFALVLPWQDEVGRKAAKGFVGSELLFYNEGAYGTVSVARHPGGILHLKINGVGEVPTDYHSLRVFRFLGYMPFVFAPQATNILVIAFGGGITFGSIMQVPGVSATNVEICRDVLEAAVLFTNFNHNVLENYRENIIIDDGYTFVLRDRSFYDLIIADATHPSSGDSWVLYTKEFYQLSAKRLRQNGLMAQWLPMHGLAIKDLQVILRTFASVFPFFRVYFCNEYLVMIGGQTKFDQSELGWQRLLNNPVIRHDLSVLHLSPDILESLLVWETGWPALWTEETPLSTRDFSPLQFSELRSRQRDTRISTIELFLGVPNLSEKTRNILLFHKMLFEKDYVAAIDFSWGLPSSAKDVAWLHQENRVEEIFLSSLQTTDGMQRYLDSEHPNREAVLRRLEPRSPLFVGVALALSAVDRGAYREAEAILSRLYRQHQEPWVRNLYKQVQGALTNAQKEGQR